MKLLIITQKVDRNDPVLGFFHNWLFQFSKKFQSILVICLEKGEYSLPENIKVFSLGKEQGVSKIIYLKNFYSYIWQERKNYDAVFVHMNQEYVLLGFKIWRILGKKIYLWRNHKKGSFLTRLAVLFSTHVFCTSSDSFTARFKKTILMPVGIDTTLFKPKIFPVETKENNKILFLSRISPVKNAELLIEALALLEERNINFSCDIYGDALPQDTKYLESLKEKVSMYSLEKYVKFFPGIKPEAAPALYSQYKIFVNLTPSGSFDKTILEAASVEVLPIIINTSLSSASEFTELIAKPSQEDIADVISWWLKAEDSLVKEKTIALRNFVEEKHSLDLLVKKIAEIIK